MYTLNSAAQEIVSYWETERVIPFKGELISRDSGGNICMCAQGQVLHKFGGYTEEQLFNMDFLEADKETARILDISVAHSVFLRRINDKCEGSPQDVLSNPAKYLGPNFEQVLDFWKFIDSLSYQEKEVIAYRFWDLDENVRESDGVAARKVAKEVVDEEFGDAAWSSAYGATELSVFGHATLELIGLHKLLEQGKTPTFLPFYIKPWKSLKPTKDSLNSSTFQKLSQIQKNILDPIGKMF